jgi:hypothetical protein
MKAFETKIRTFLFRRGILKRTISFGVVVLVFSLNRQNYLYQTSVSRSVASSICFETIPYSRRAQLRSGEGCSCSVRRSRDGKVGTVSPELVRRCKQKYIKFIWEQKRKNLENMWLMNFENSETQG